MSAPGGLRTRVRELLQNTASVYRDSPRAREWLQRHLDRYEEPLRLAIAGKVKAGKSTLLNALVGEEIAATDAGECTKIVTWYQEGSPPAVTLFPQHGPPRPLRLERRDRALAIDLGGASADEVDRLVVSWPSRSLRTTSLIDTPGIASLSTEVSARADAFLRPDEAPTQADAVLYLMRHLHAADARFLESFHDQGVAKASAVNTVAVLSRADEVGACRLDAMAAAAEVAARYRVDEQLSGLCQTVVPVAGLLALTGRTLRQAEFTALTAIAGLEPADTERLLLTADRFRRPPSELLERLPPVVAVEGDRADLLLRFGLFGLRLGVALVRDGTADPVRMSSALVQRSGLDELREVLGHQFTERRDVLKARSALLAVDAVLRAEPRPAAARLATEIERIVAGAHEFAELTLLSHLRSRAVPMSAQARAEAERLLGGSGGQVAARLGLEPGAAPDLVRTAVLDALVRWQRRAENPLADRSENEAARVVVRSCEGILAALPVPRSPADHRRAPGLRR